MLHRSLSLRSLRCSLRSAYSREMQRAGQRAVRRQRSSVCACLEDLRQQVPVKRARPLTAERDGGFEDRTGAAQLPPKADAPVARCQPELVGMGDLRGPLRELLETTECDREGC